MCRVDRIAGDISSEIRIFFGLGYTTINEISELIIAVLLAAVWGKQTKTGD
jgi:hypothetical protein